MFESTVGEILEATGARPCCGASDTVVRGACIDSRQVGEGGLFVCFPGERVDGNDYAPKAIEAGAHAVALTREASDELVRQAEEAGCALMRIQGDDAEEFMLRLAGAWRRKNPQWTVVGVTGSVGKTTTKDMLACSLATRYRVHATKGNFNNLIGVPLTMLSASPDDELVVCEMGMNHTGELERLSACALPTVAVITNVGTSHIGLLGSRENIARAKAEILSSMEPSDKSVNGVSPCLAMTSDNDFASFIEEGFARPRGVEVVYVGASQGARVSARDVRLDGEGFASFDLCLSDGWSLPVKLTVPGPKVIADFLLAMAIVDRLGVDREAAARAIEQMPQTHMRLEVVKKPGRPRVIDDSYNASPSSMAAALDVLASMSCEGRRVAVLGEMGELGSEADRLHGYVGAYAAAKDLDLLVFVGTEEALQMADAARTMGFSEDKLEIVEDVDAAKRVIAPILKADDLVLVKASRSAGLDAFAQEVLA